MLQVFVAAFPQPMIGTREDKKSLSKSISNGLKRWNKKTGILLLEFGVSCGGLRFCRKKVIEETVNQNKVSPAAA